MVEHLATLRRVVHVVNLDPAAERFEYPVLADVRELIQVEDVMEDDELALGPNGALVFCMEHLVGNPSWLQEALGETQEDYLLFDCPGQIELYTHLPVMSQLIGWLQNWDFRICVVFLLDSQFMVESFKFLSGVLAALSAMVSLEVPQVNVMTKMDLLSPAAQKEVERFLDPDLYSLMEDSAGAWRSRKFQDLTRAIYELVDDYGLVRFIPLNREQPDTIQEVVQLVDSTLQIGDEEEFREPQEISDEANLEEFLSSQEN
uniref:GPN-loop GTPase 3 n=1 Tax=Eptatretus burgeri TaxID=7764 RepID=A0A8C4RBV5_EPTBU